MKLYELTEAFENHIFVDEETGLVDVELFNQLKMERKEKLESLIKYIKNIDSDSDQLRTEAKKLIERADKLDKKADWAKNYLSENMKACSEEKLEFTCGVAKFNKSTAVEVDDDFINWAICSKANNLLSYKQPTVNKTAVKAFIKLNGSCEHAQIVERKNLQIK